MRIRTGIIMTNGVQKPQCFKVYLLKCTLLSVFLLYIYTKTVSIVCT